MGGQKPKGGWESQDSAIELVRGNLIPKRLRTRRLRVFQKIGFFSYCYFLSADLYHGAFWLPVLDLACLVCIGVSFFLQRQQETPTLAAWIYLLGLDFSLAVSPLFADALDSAGLWSISLIPMLSACVLNERATTIWTVIASLEIIIVALAGGTWAFPLEATDTDAELVVIIIVSLGVHSLSAYMLSSHLVSQFRLLADRQERIRRAHEAENRANDAKTAFLARMSHEIRTPMNGLLGMMESLNARESMRAEWSTIETVQRCGENLLSLLNDILDLSKVESGTVELHNAPLDLCEVVKDLQQLFAAQALLSGIEIRLELACESYWCVGDDTRIRQVVSNILGNALKFCEGHPVTIRVYSGAHTGAGTFDAPVLIEIEDRGIGMTRAQQAKVFEQYEQIDSQATFNKGGTGLGLSISHELVQKMGGRIDLESELGRGSIFRIILPLQRHQPAGRGVEGGELALPNPVSKVAFRVLVADDNAINRKVAQLALERLSCTVVSAHNGEEALERANEQAFDLILMDMSMPVMDGLQATRKIIEGKGINARTPIVALTANAFAQDVQACLDAGMVEHLAKPVRGAVLASVIERHCSAPQEEQKSA